MLGFFVSPVGLEPGAAPAFADEMQNFRGVIGQEKLYGAKRFDDERHIIADRWVAFAPRDVVLNIPAALGLRSIEEFFIELKKSIFELGVGGSIHLGRYIIAAGTAPATK